MEESLKTRYVCSMLKKLSIIVASCACSFLFAISANAATVTLGTVNADALNIRSAPTTECTSLGLLPTNHEVVIVGQEDNWYKILHGTSYAYVSKDYIIVTATDVEYTIPAAPATNSAVGTTNSFRVPIASGAIPSYIGSQIPGEVLVETAKQFLGTPYVYGGMSPQGFDCSGFVKYCYSLMGVDINRIACDQALNGVEVPIENMLPGDILCFASSIGGSYIGHTGIYVGNGYFIHSPRTGYSVEFLPLDATSYGKRIANVRRIF